MLLSGIANGQATYDLVALAILPDTQKVDIHYIADYGFPRGRTSGHNFLDCSTWVSGAWLSPNADEEMHRVVHDAVGENGFIAKTRGIQDPTPGWYLRLDDDTNWESQEFIDSSIAVWCLQDKIELQLPVALPDVPIMSSRRLYPTSEHGVLIDWYVRDGVEVIEFSVLNGGSLSDASLYLADPFGDFEASGTISEANGVIVFYRQGEMYPAAWDRRWSTEHLDQMPRDGPYGIAVNFNIDGSAPSYVVEVHPVSRSLRFYKVSLDF